MLLLALELCEGGEHTYHLLIESVSMSISISVSIYRGVRRLGGRQDFTDISHGVSTDYGWEAGSWVGLS